MSNLMSAKLIEAIEGAGYDAVRSYSGRFMYGKRCIAVVVSDVFAFIADLVEGYGDNIMVARWIREMKQDDMGRDTVLYWPKHPWLEE